MGKTNDFGQWSVRVDDRGQIALDGPEFNEPLELPFTGWLELQRHLDYALGRAHLMACDGVQIPWS
jgi:hypothetical protein